MRALTMTGPSHGTDRTEIRETDETPPGPGEVAIAVAFAGINFIDVMTRRGDAGYGDSWPYVPGMEVSGTVRAVGEGVDGLEPGQRVAAFTKGGGLAEIAKAQAAHTVRVPDAVPLATAAAAPLLYTTALLLVRDAARFRPGETVLVHSASGGLGHAVSEMIAILGGGKRIGTVGRQSKADAALRNGFDAALVRDEGLPEAVRAANGGAGVDIVLDPLGTTMLDADLELTAPGGRIILFGNASGSEFGALPTPGRLIGGNVSVGGFSIGRLWAAAPQRVSSALREVLRLLADDRLRLAPNEVDALEDVPAVHQLLAEGRGEGKYVVKLAS